MRRTITTSRPHLVDVWVGKRIVERRRELGITQSQLAKAAEITFQQVQKYEKGANRVSASRLWQFAQALGMDVADFFDGLEDAGPDKTEKASKPATKTDLDIRREAMALPVIRQKLILKLIREMPTTQTAD